jgi:hypothetical protein
MNAVIYLSLTVLSGCLAFALPSLFKRDSYFLNILVYLLLMVALVGWVNFLVELL